MNIPQPYEPLSILHTALNRFHEAYKSMGSGIFSHENQTVGDVIKNAF